MEAKPGILVKAVYDFPTDEEAELPLLVGDVIQVKERIDKQWSRGVCANREGNFPIGFTVDVKTPQLEAHQLLFAATNDFIAQENGDLPLTKGDLVIGNNPIDSNWWSGEREDGSSGIFPTTHVWKVDKSMLPVTSTNKKMFARARVKMNMTAQLPEEMDLFKDDIVNIIEEVEKGWYRGECNGHRGIFPASFVTVLPDSTAESFNLLVTPESEPSNTSIHAERYDNKYGYDCINSGITPYGRALYPFEAKYANELSLKGEEIVNLIKHVDSNWIEGEVDGKTGIFPANFINIIVDCPKADKLLSEESNSVNEADANAFPPDTYARVISDFHPLVEGDVRLREGDTVTLIRKIDHNWYEVMTDNGDSGICPESYVEIIGSGPPSYSEVMASVVNNSLLDTDWNSTDDAKHTSKSDRPLSFASSASDSSFSSQNNTNDKSAKGTHNAENFGLDSSLLSSDSSFNSNKSLHNYDNFGENQSSRGDSFSSSHDTSPKPFNDWESSPNSVGAAQCNLTSIPRIIKTPARPPPPANLILSENSSTLCNSFNSPVNSARQSMSSASSHDSSENFLDSAGDSEILNQIQNKEQTLKQRMNCLNKLENEVKNTYNTSVASELKIQISQLNEDIDRLKKDIATLNAKLKPDLSQSTSEQSTVNDRQLREEEVARKKEVERKRREQEKIKKLKEQRECIITEMLQTERDYVADLKLLHDTFLINPQEAKSKGINIDTLFGNLDEVIKVADQLLRRLQKVAQNNQLIGECFVDMSGEMKEIYGNYCQNHDEANTVLDKIDLQSSAGQFLYHKLEVLKRQTNCFDLGAMLIKPVQRILKYPLLLDQLHKCTEDGHPDKEGLKQAIGTMSDVATAINEFKRRKDIIYKYLKPNDTSLSERISKINLHSMAKKSTRFGMRLSSSIGLTSVAIDQDFEVVARKFLEIEKSVKEFLKNLNNYTKKAEDRCACALDIAEGIAELYQERKSQQEVDQFRVAHRNILTKHWESFKQTVDNSIQPPMKHLLLAYKGPKNLIAKRQDKLLDYLSSTNKMDKNKDATKIKMLQETQQMDKNNYEALNSQLLDDLPKLCNLSVEILCDCISCFLKAKKNFTGRSAKHILDLMDLPLMLGNQGADLIETFQVKHTLVLDDLSRLSIASKQFQSCIKTDTLKRNSSGRGSKLSFGMKNLGVKSQTPSQKAKIKSTYLESELYTTCENYDAVDIMDVSLKKGDVVGVIKQQDPMGNRTRWFVDRGDAKGFVPVKNLMKYLPESSSCFTYPGSAWDTVSSNTTSSTSTSANASDRQTIYSKPQKVTPQPQTLQPQSKQNGIIQPTRPAPPVTASLRMVAPSRYPPSPQPTISKPKQNSSSNFQRPVNPSITPNQRTFTSNVPSNIQRSVTPTVSPNIQRTVTPNMSPIIQRTVASNVSPNTNVCNINPNDSPNLNVNSNAMGIEPIHRYEEVPDTIHSVDVQNKCLRLLGDAPTVTQSGTSNILDEFDPYSSGKLPEVYDNVPDNLNSLYNSHRYEDIPEDSFYEEVPNEVEPSTAEEYYFALYEFVPTGTNQLLLRKGQVVLVLHKCDLNQNSEWWFVEDRHGNKGYVPSLYLSRYSKDAA